MSLLFRTNRRSAVDWQTPGATVTGSWPTRDAGRPLSDSPTANEVYATQPSLRKVVEFIAKNIARVKVQAYSGDPNGLRKPLPADHPLAQMLAKPHPQITWYQLMHDLVCDLLIYDRFLCVATPDSILTRYEPELWTFHPVPQTLDKVDGYQLGTRPADQYVPFASPQYGVAWWGKGYGGSQGVSPMETLRQTLDEHTESVEWRREIWKNGLRMPGYWTQDLSEAALSHDARRRLQEELANFVANGGKEGQSPILRGIGYTAMPTPFTPQSAQEIEGRTLADIEVASAYGVPPEMVGARVSNYASQQAFRDALYRETLGPLFTQMQSAFNLHICDQLFPGCFMEFNIDSALRGSFVDDAQVTSSAVGGPWLSVNEARISHGYEPKSAEYDEILTQLNTVRGGGPLASPHDTGSQNLGGHTA